MGSKSGRPLRPSRAGTGQQVRARTSHEEFLAVVAHVASDLHSEVGWGPAILLRATNGSAEEHCQVGLGGALVLRCWRADSFWQLNLKAGRLAERFKALVLKTSEGSRPPWVRIPRLPHFASAELLAHGRGTWAIRCAYARTEVYRIAKIDESTHADLVLIRCMGTLTMKLVR